VNVVTLHRRKSCRAVGEAKGLTVAHTAKQLQARYSAGTCCRAVVCVCEREREREREVIRKELEQ